MVGIVCYCGKGSEEWDGGERVEDGDGEGVGGVDVWCVDVVCVYYGGLCEGGGEGGVLGEGWEDGGGEED